ncbi:MAG: ribonuclease III [Betaproteobacteria bacterium TMED82]|nr:MAG: ribonuclease III [Betaproteobacteria bacterium TMED82]|tara:strand:+ start:22313 stop:23053 length:741 start_codon:yes stop_codon:yes gene_type:complete
MGSLTINLQTIRKFQKTIGYQFTKHELLLEALTHKSFGQNHYERLEFLGDSVLNTVISNYLFSEFPKASEGELSRMRANLVDKSTLLEIGTEIEIAPLLLMTEGKKSNKEKFKMSALSDAVESVFGAIFIDGGLEAVTAVILRAYKPLLDFKTFETLSLATAKTLLQEIVQKNKSALPVYSLIKTTGPDHNLKFFVSCKIKWKLNNDRIFTLVEVASGDSLKQAEQNAAEIILHKLEKKNACNISK